LPSSAAATLVHVFCAKEVADVAATRFKAVMHALVVGFPELRLDDCVIVGRVTRRVATVGRSRLVELPHLVK